MTGKIGKIKPAWGAAMEKGEEPSLSPRYQVWAGRVSFTGEICITGASEECARTSRNCFLGAAS
jgi:hypothetical protein